MHFLALKMLMGDRLKYFGLIAGIAFAAVSARPPRGMRLMVEALRWVMPASSSSEIPSVRRRVRSRVRTKRSMLLSSAIKRS